MGSSSSHVPWEHLSETLRDANRHVADHAPAKLWLLGLLDVEKAQSAESPLIDGDLLEFVARVEHQRWVAERALAGWTFAATRDDRFKHHPSLAPWDALNEDEKEKDRAVVRGLPSLYARVGRALVRQGAKN
jgi:hypothetical protein